jgi:hypothetical protein
MIKMTEAEYRDWHERARKLLAEIGVELPDVSYERDTVTTETHVVLKFKDVAAGSSDYTIPCSAGTSNEVKVPLASDK